ncbi:hypothetical protein TNCV_3865821 [Trichonephila clavipes]|nr:hypothetical protein TNCV_3865821 [Trichonephila clavipes]
MDWQREIARKQYEREYSTEVKYLFVDKDKPFCVLHPMDWLRTAVVAEWYRYPDRGLPCHEFEPNTIKDPPCRAAMHVKTFSVGVVWELECQLRCRPRHLTMRIFSRDTRIQTDDATPRRSRMNSCRPPISSRTGYRKNCP